MPPRRSSWIVVDGPSAGGRLARFSWNPAAGEHSRLERPRSSGRVRHMDLHRQRVRLPDHGAVDGDVRVRRLRSPATSSARRRRASATPRSRRRSGHRSRCSQSPPARPAGSGSRGVTETCTVCVSPPERSSAASSSARRRSRWCRRHRQPSNRVPVVELSQVETAVGAERRLGRRAERERQGRRERLRALVHRDGRCGKDSRVSLHIAPYHSKAPVKVVSALSESRSAGSFAPLKLSTYAYT